MTTDFHSQNSKSAIEFLYLRNRLRKYKMDFISSLQHTGFTARIKRLSDRFIYDAKRLYIDQNLDIEPNWHLILLLLKHKGEMTVTEISSELGFSHPAIIKIIKKMHSADYIVLSRHKSDRRKQLISLSQKARDRLPLLQNKWLLIASVIEELIEEQMLDQLSKIELKLQSSSLYDRCITKINNHG